MGGARTKDVVCCDCGALMEGVSAKRKRCPECAHKHKTDITREGMRRLRGSAPVESSMMENRDTDGCEGCIFFRGGFEVNRCCNYIFIMKKRRPCPPGEGCTVKIERKGYREKKKRSTDIS